MKIAKHIFDNEDYHAFFTENINMNSYLFTSESISESQPNKLPDQISEIILDAILEQDSTARDAAQKLANPSLIVLE